MKDIVRLYITIYIYFLLCHTVRNKLHRLLKLAALPLRNIGNADVFFSLRPRVISLWKVFLTNRKSLIVRKWWYKHFKSCNENNNFTMIYYSRFLQIVQVCLKLINPFPFLLLETRRFEKILDTHDIIQLRVYNIYIMYMNCSDQYLLDLRSTGLLSLAGLRVLTN